MTFDTKEEHLSLAITLLLHSYACRRIRDQVVVPKEEHLWTATDFITRDLQQMEASGRDHP